MGPIKDCALSKANGRALTDWTCCLKACSARPVWTLATSSWVRPKMSPSCASRTNSVSSRCIWTARSTKNDQNSSFWQKVGKILLLGKVMGGDWIQGHQRVRVGKSLDKPSTPTIRTDTDSEVWRASPRVATSQTDS